MSLSFSDAMLPVGGGGGGRKKEEEGSVRKRSLLSNCGYGYRQRHLQAVRDLEEEAELAKDRKIRRKEASRLRRLCCGDEDILDCLFQIFRVIVVALWLAAFLYGLILACKGSFERYKKAKQEEEEQDYYYG